MTLIGESNAENQGTLAHWNTFSLAQKYLVSSAVVVVAGTLIIGAWVSRQIENGVTSNAAIATALYVDSFISPLTTELETSETLSVGPIRALDEVFKDGVLENRLFSVKIWRLDGTIVYSSNYDLIGKKFTPTEELLEAVNGKVSASFDSLNDEEDASERQSNIPLLEIYSPIRAPWTGEVIAVTEFYEDGTELQRSLSNARIKSWLVVAAVMTSIAALLMTFVFRASRTIEFQQKALRTQLDEVSESARQNQRLRSRLQLASERVTELNERFLKRTSAELHDGPAQLLSFASLRLGEARKLENKAERDREFIAIERALNDAMAEIRDVCKGLSLPDIKGLTVQETIKRACRAITDRNGRDVILNMVSGSLDASLPVKICTYRFIQEALNNSFKHAPDSRASVACFFNKSTGELSTLR